MTRFRLFSTDIAATLTPDAASPAPSLNIKFDHDPHDIQISPPAGRGAVIRTGGGVVYHDLGVVEGDGTIKIEGTVERGEWLRQPTIDALRAAYLSQSKEYFFTDGAACWRVRFSRQPAGFHAWRHQFLALHGRIEYSYELTFLVVKTELA